MRTVRQVEAMRKGMARHNRRQLESMKSTAELTAEAQSSYLGGGRWPTRRFRVVSSMGRSRLLTESRAAREAVKYGGHVEEAIPSRKASGVVRPKADAK